MTSADHRPTRSTPTRYSSWPRCPNRSPPPSSHTRSAPVPSAGTPRSSTRCRGSRCPTRRPTRMVTVGDLFAHRSGLPDHAGDMLEDLGYDRRNILQRLRLLPLAPFRTSYAYTNFGVTAAAEAAAAAPAAVGGPQRRRALPALGMTSTSSRFADFVARPDKAVGPRPRRTASTSRDTPADPDPQSPAGGVSASVNDLTHWLTMMLADGRYGGATDRRPESTAARGDPADACPTPPSEPAMRLGFYGYGFNVGTTSPAGRSAEPLRGVLARSGNEFRHHPGRRRGHRRAHQRRPSGVPETLTAEFADLVQFGEVREDWRKLYADAFPVWTGRSVSLGRQGATGQPCTATPAAGVRRHLHQPLLGRRRRWPRRTASSPWPLARARTPTADALGRRCVHLRFVDRKRPSGNHFHRDVRRGQVTLEYFDDDKMGTFTR